jgi:hypothetical protein
MDTRTAIARCQVGRARPAHRARRNAPASLPLRIGVTITMAFVLCVLMLAQASERAATDFSYDALNARIPVVRQHSYVVNAKVRPLLAFWIGRENVGTARVTWRGGSGGRHGYELLIGSDPARAPRHINRWGFIVEEFEAGRAEVLGVMKESNEETIEAAEAEISRPQSASAFKASRTTITGNQALNAATTLQAPAHLTYRERDAILGLMAGESPVVRTMQLPPGTQNGFLVAMDSLLHASVIPCQTRQGGKAMPAVTYIYGRTLFDLSLLSCKPESALKTKSLTYTDVIDGRFQVRNRTTRDETKFRVLYGASGELCGVPVRAVFRPRWWMEVELLLDLPARENK